MIGGRLSRAPLAALVVILVLGLSLGQRAADPSSADPPAAAARAQRLARVAQSTDAALRRLSELLEATLKDARSGAALTVAGNDPPAPPLTAAAERLAAGTAVADRAQSALGLLMGTAAAIEPAAALPPLSLNGQALTSIADQLRAAALVATAFVARRHATDRVLQALSGALAALERDDPHSALDLLAGTDAPLSLIRTWPSPPVTLALWLTTTADLLAAVRAVAAATLAGDASAEREAAARYQNAAQAARGADVSLALALSEGGAAVTATPLRRLTDGLADLAALREAIAPLAEGR
jgi:hypothetical protein